MKKSMPNFYVRFIFTCPLTVIALSISIFLILPIIFLFLRPLKLGNDPEKGFETDGTAYSGPRLAWTHLQSSILQGSRIQFAPQLVPSNRPKRSWADELVTSFGSVACYNEPIIAMSFLAQFIVQVPNFDHIFRPDFLSQMCHLHDELAPEISAFFPFSPYRTIWHFPNFLGCLIPKSRANCSFIDEKQGDISIFRKHFHRCLPHRQNILACRRPCHPNRHFNAIPQIECSNKEEKQGICAKIPSECGNQMWFDLFYRILPEDLGLEPLPINNFLPFYSLTAYRLQGIDIPLKAFADFEAKLIEIIQDKMFILKGLSFDTKHDFLLEAAIRDSRFSLFSAFAVFLLLLFYSLSLAFAIAVFVQLSAAVFASLAIFRIFVPEFPLLNMIAFVLLISIGSDGAFLLLDIFPVPEKLNQPSFARALVHLAKTCALTQFSTVVPFLLNLLSSVFAFRSFGLFAGLTLIFNYFLLISFLPAFLVIQNRYFNPWLSRFWPSRYWYCFQSSSLDPLPNIPSAPISSSHLANFPSRMPSSRLDRSRHFFKTLLDQVLPAVLIQGRFVWISSMFIFSLVSLYLCLTQLSLPRFNPLQLFRASNPHEYFDQNAEQLFSFISDKIAALPFAIRLVWGIQFLDSPNYLDPNQILQTLPKTNSNFRLDSPAQIQSLAQQIEQIRQLPFVKWQNKFWPERFIEWSIGQQCSSNSASALSAICCNFENAQFSLDFFDRCIRFSTTQLAVGYNDTLIWDNQTHHLVGYTALIPTELAYTHRFSNLSTSFALLDKSILLNQISSLPGWFTTEWTIISQWFDLQNSIIADCKQSFIVSFVVVFIFSAFMLRVKEAFCATLTIFGIVLCTIGTLVFIGWEIGVLEGVILVLVVGLSFDYTLHFGAVFLDSGCSKHRIQQTIRLAIRPVAMSALSSILAGGIMLFSETHAFFQVAIFLVVCSTLSFIFATFFFIPIIFCTIPSQSKNNCQWCVAQKRQENPLKMSRLRQNNKKNEEIEND